MAATIHKLPAPPHTADDARESTHIVRERYFSPRAAITDILDTLRESSATGTLTLNLNQGSVGTISFQERKKISFT